MGDCTAKAENVTMQDIIKVKTFGGFSISYGDKTISDQDNRSKKLWAILEYIIAFHDRTIPQSTIIDLIWNEDSISADPENALKTCLHRVRGLLDELEIPEKKIITRKQGTFSWNNSIPCNFDFEEFIVRCNKAATMESDEERLENYREAFWLYGGDFLPKCSTEVWASGLAARYRTIYIKMVSEYMALLLEYENYDEITDCCSIATSIDPLDSDINYYLIYALYKSGQQMKAIEQYQRVVGLYYDEFGVEPDERLRTLYNEITTHEKGVEADLDTIQRDLYEKNADKQAYMCDYSVFKHFYKVQARTCARNGMSIYLCLVTINQFKSDMPDLHKVAMGMERMRDIIATSLRASDVYSRFSKNQYIAMLPTACYENSIMIGERILKNFDKSRPKLNLNVSFAVRYLEPQMFEDELNA